MKTFAGIPEAFAEYQNSDILLQSIPYDGTSTWGKGADKGFDAFLEASENMELYDIETDSEVYKRGIHMLPEMAVDGSPEDVYHRILEASRTHLKSNKFLTYFGGEHSISIGVIQAFYEQYSDLTVVQLDAHADLRASYLGSPYNHACALHDASKHSNLIQVGIRSMDASEKAFLNPVQCFFAQDISGQTHWMTDALALMSDHIYITIDLDVFDPSIMPATGTPEPGGLMWYETLTFLRQIFKNKTVLGFDIVELAPIAKHKSSEFLAAKLYYKLLSYKFKYHVK